ncbi:uncharacterized protein LOC133473967 [Phyllopteryx taeniolatus]|uniref:uncharacterized protein LOC133473967 n=1 Tax=Phyllopteryx taeniolatus TaxID=161469 RepID=UPI002AD1D133|nr:uncharacterized protein LOC133473967 [Phyllopteryx taeniolatus]
MDGLVVGQDRLKDTKQVNKMDLGRGEGLTGCSGVVNKNVLTRRYEKELTLILEIDNGDAITPLILIRGTAEVCGSITACRVIAKDKYEVTVNSVNAKEKLLDGFCIGSARIHGREVTSDELVVSFMGLPAYIEDNDILEKLQAWGVSAVSEVRRRMWPGTDIADGTRFVKVKFTTTVQSLPYSARFVTAAGPEYFRVIHDRQVKVCRGCLSPSHVYRDCPEFLCRKCGVQGHYARECQVPNSQRCATCRQYFPLCVCEKGKLDGGMPCTRGADAKSSILPVSSGSVAAGLGESTLTRLLVEAPVTVGAGGIVPRPTPKRGGGEEIPIPDAWVAEAEPEMGVSAGPSPLSAPEQEEATVEFRRTPRPTIKSPKRRKDQIQSVSSIQKGGTSQNSEGRNQTGLSGGDVSIERLARFPVSQLFPPRITRSSATLEPVLDSDEGMEIDVMERKKRQSEGTGKGGLKKKSGQATVHMVESE